MCEEYWPQWALSTVHSLSSWEGDNGPEAMQRHTASTLKRVGRTAAPSLWESSNLSHFLCSWVKKEVVHKTKDKVKGISHLTPKEICLGVAWVSYRLPTLTKLAIEAVQPFVTIVSNLSLTVVCTANMCQSTSESTHMCISRKISLTFNFCIIWFQKGSDSNSWKLLHTFPRHQFKCVDS